MPSSDATLSPEMPEMPPDLPGSSLGEGPGTKPPFPGAGESPEPL